MRRFDAVAKSDGRKHVLIAGGGVAGLEAMLALSELAEGLVEVELISPTPEFVYRPLLVAEPFGAAEVLRLDLGRAASETGARHTQEALVAVDPGACTVATASGGALSYDFLLVATGAKPREAVPGAITFSGEEERVEFGKLLAAMGRRGMQRIAFVVPREVSWSIAAYELALLTAAERDARAVYGVDLILVTHETGPLDVFGPATSQLVSSRLDEAGIALRTGAVADRVERGALLLESGESLDADGVVALPGLEVPTIPGLPQRNGGFVQTDVRMRVAGLESVWAAGDATWFPVKQGGLAAQQSDAAARSIAAAAGAHVPLEAFQPVLRAALITGDAPEFLRSSLSDHDPVESTVGRGLWWPAGKIAGRYLGPYLARRLGEDPGDELVDLDSSTDRPADAAEHEQAIQLVLAAADADAEAGDFAGALRWLDFVERLNLVIPEAYVTRRDEWRRRLEPDLAPSEAAQRIDPTLASPEAAISDLQRRLGWMRELERKTEGGMSEHLQALDRGMEELRGLTRRAGLAKRPGAQNPRRSR
jgi:sulfide:quinone oxidoreductase